MDLLTVASPALRLLFERVGKPEVANLPALLLPGGKGAVIVCNHVGWADSLWMGYAVYPRQLCHLSKQELFGSPITKWILTQSGAIPIDRVDTSPGTIKTAVDLLHCGQIILVFPSGTRNQEDTEFKRGAATIGLHAQVPIVPAFYQGPREMTASHLVNRPRISITFGLPIETAGMPINKTTAFALTRYLQIETEKLGINSDLNALAA